MIASVVSILPGRWGMIRESLRYLVLLPADDHSTRVAPELAHGYSLALKPRVLFRLHDCVRLRCIAPAVKPFRLGRDRLAGLAGDAHGQLVVMLHLRHGASK